MYAVVGCGSCSALWVIEDDRTTTACPRCSTRHQVADLRFLAEAADEAAIREARAQLLAHRQDDATAFEQVDSYADLEATVYDDVVDDETYLAASGIDPDAVEAADTTDPGETLSRDEVVRNALRTLDSPTETAVVAYATDRGVSQSYVTKALEKLETAGEVVRDGDTYRLL